MDNNEYFSHLYEIARNLNKEYSLHSALRKALEKTVELLHLETGWIWLVQEDNKTVYLAASYNLPPALSRYPERLSGRCFCIDNYLADGIVKAFNISEIACTRLGNIHIKSGTRGLKYHATVPITIEGRKVGLINLVSKESQQLDENKLSVLSTISELVSIAIQRTRLYESADGKHGHDAKSLQNVLSKLINPGLQELMESLEKTQSLLEKGKQMQSLNQVKSIRKQAGELLQQISAIVGETSMPVIRNTSENSIHYPTSPLTVRELEVLGLVRKGLLNKQIAEQMFISERTVKFHMSSILSKLLARTRTEAVQTAIQRGLLNV